METTNQQPANALPVHSTLAALNLPPLPWAGHGPFFEVFAADDWEVAYVPQKPSHVTDVTRYAHNTAERRAAIGRVIAAGPDVVNAALHVIDWLTAEYQDTPENVARGREAFAALMAATARALPQEREQEGGATA